MPALPIAIDDFAPSCEKRSDHVLDLACFSRARHGLRPAVRVPQSTYLLFESCASVRSVQGLAVVTVGDLGPASLDRVVCPPILIPKGYPTPNSSARLDHEATPEGNQPRFDVGTCKFVERRQLSSLVR